MNISALPENVVREVDALTADLFREDDLGAVLRVQLRIENVLDQLIMTLLPSPVAQPPRFAESPIRRKWSKVARCQLTP